MRVRMVVAAVVVARVAVSRSLVSCAWVQMASTSTSGGMMWAVPVVAVDPEDAQAPVVSVVAVVAEVSVFSSSTPRLRTRPLS